MEKTEIVGGDIRKGGRTKGLVVGVEGVLAANKVDIPRAVDGEVLLTKKSK